MLEVLTTKSSEMAYGSNGKTLCGSVCCDIKENVNDGIASKPYILASKILAFPMVPTIQWPHRRHMGHRPKK